MERIQEGGEFFGLAWVKWGLFGGCTGKPGKDAPGPGIDPGRRADADRCRDGDGELRCEGGQPALFVEDQGGGCLASG